MRVTAMRTGVIVALLTTGPVFAEPKGRGRGAEQDPADRAAEAGKRVTNEAIDAVADELAGPPASDRSMRDIRRLLDQTLIFHDGVLIGKGR